MKILIDIGHPSHVHYFRNLISIMQKKGHEFVIIARDKDITQALLKIYNIPFSNRGKGAISFSGKLFDAFNKDYFIYKIAKKTKPDLFLSFASPYAAQVATIFGKPHIAIDDTDHANFSHKMYVPFSDAIITPISFKKDFGKNHILINGTPKLCYLHKNYFIPNPDIYNYLKINSNDRYVILRFVALNASHDLGEKGIDLGLKIELAKKLSEKFKVFISSENELPLELKKYKINIPFEKMHDALYYAELIIGESGMSSEAIMLGTQSIGVWKEINGVNIDEIKYGMLHHYHYSTKEIISKAMELLYIPDFKRRSQELAARMLNDYIDVTAFLVWFIERFPESKHIMQINPDYQNKFKV
jgi:uncharacterized protein